MLPDDIVKELKKPSPIFSIFFFNIYKFWQILLSQESHIFLITHGKFYSWKVFRLEDIN